MIAWEDVGTRRQQLLHLRILLGDELDHQIPPHRRHKIGDVVERHVVADGQMVDQRQRQYQIRGPRWTRLSAQHWPSPARGWGWSDP